MKKNFRKASRGLTFVEVLIAVAILAVLTTVAFTGLFSHRESKRLVQAGDNITGALRDAQARSISQMNGVRWGIHFDNTSSSAPFYNIFSGTTYSSAGVASQYRLSMPLVFTNPPPGTTLDVFFLPISGQTTSTIITIAGTANAGIMDVIAKSNGLISQYFDTGLVGYWHFNEGSGATSTDSSGRGNNGTLQNSPTWLSGSNCKSGNCLSFDGTDDNVNLGSPTVLNLGAGNFSLCTWFKTTDTEADIISNGISTNGDYLLMSYLGKLRGHIWYSANSNTIDSVKTVNDNSWYYGCQVVDSTKIYLYIDGAYDNSQNLAGTKTGVTATVRIGDRDGVANSNNFAGTIDEVRIYNRALSATEISNLYNFLK